MILITGRLSSCVSTCHLWWALCRGFPCNLCGFTKQWRPIKLTNNCLDASNSEVSGSSATCTTRLKYRIQIYAGSQTASSNCNEMVQNWWLQDKHTHTYTITHNISQYHFGETPSLWEASFLEDARSAAVGSGNRKSDMLDKAQYGPMSKLTKILQKHVQPPLLSAGHGSLMMQAIHSFLVCGQISWRYSHRPIGLGFLCFALFRLGRFRGRHSSLQ